MIRCNTEQLDIGPRRVIRTRLSNATKTHTFSVLAAMQGLVAIITHAVSHKQGARGGKDGKIGFYCNC